MKLIWLLIPIFLLAGCSSQPDYAETLKEWQAQQDNTQIVALQGQNAKVAAELATLQKKYSQGEADKKNLQSQVDLLTNQNQQLQNELSKRPEQSDITAVLKANQEALKQYNEITAKYNALLPMWQQPLGKW